MSKITKWNVQIVILYIIRIKKIIEYEGDDFSSSHSDKLPELGGIDSGPGIMMADDDREGSLTDQLYKFWKHKPNQGKSLFQYQIREKNVTITNTIMILGN